MSTAEIGIHNFEGFSQPTVASAPQCHVYHRIREVRHEQGCSLRRVAQLMKIEIAQARREEDPSTDLPLSRLVEWQKVLEVPLADLLIDSDAPLSPPVLERARMVRMMKTAVAIQENTRDATVRRLAETLITQIKEVMPELEGVTGWTSLNPRRTQRQFGRIVTGLDRLFDWYNRET